MMQILSNEIFVYELHRLSFKTRKAHKIVPWGICIMLLHRKIKTKHFKVIYEQNCQKLWLILGKEIEDRSKKVGRARKIQSGDIYSRSHCDSHWMEQISNNPCIPILFTLWRDYGKVACGKAAEWSTVFPMAISFYLGNFTIFLAFAPFAYVH